MTFAAFARAPLLWSAAVLAIYAPFAFIQPVVQEPPEGCDDWLWCDSRFVGLTFDPTLELGHIWALLIIPGAFLAFLAAHIDGRSARTAHWYMAPFVLTLIGLVTYFLIEPFGLFINVSESYQPAVIMSSLGIALVLAIFASVLCGLIVVAGALIWRWCRGAPAAS